MALADLLAVEAATRKGPPCTVKLILDALDTADRASLLAALDGTTRDDSGAMLTTAAIARALTSNGQRIGADTVGRHRQGICMCGR